MNQTFFHVHASNGVTFVINAIRCKVHEKKSYVEFFNKRKETVALFALNEIKGFYKAETNNPAMVIGDPHEL